MTNLELVKDFTDSEILFLTLVGEARGEPIQGQIAVANVIANRAKERGLSIREVCLQPKQFSCWNINDVNRPLLEELAKEFIYSSSPTEKYSQLWWVVAGVVDRKINDNTKGSNHYLTSTLFASTNAPEWSKKFKQEPVVIGHHTFLKL